MNLKNWRNSLNTFLEDYWWLRDWLKGEKYLPLPPLSRGGKIVRNLLVTVPVLLLIWGSYGYPLPTEEMDFRRWERQNLLKPAKMALNMRSEPGGDEIVGLSENHVLAVETGDGGGWYLYERNLKGVTPVFTAGYYGWFDPDEMRLRSIRGVVVPDMPEGAAKSTLAIWENGSWHRFEGERQELGAWLYPVHGLGSTHISHALHGYTYELTAYDGQGTLLVQQKGTFP